MRPLISTGDPRKSVDISRKAELYETSSGLLTITGGKLTTWRRMAKQVVDRMVEREGRTVVVDDLAAASPNLVAGSNRHGYHLLNVNVGRDFAPDLGVPEGSR